MEDKYTSLELAKKLKEAGCEIESEKLWVESYKASDNGTDKVRKIYSEFGHNYNEFKTCPNGVYFAYDIMWDICIVHAKEFFGEESVLTGLYQQGYECVHGTNSMEYVESRNYAYIYYSKRILLLMQQGNKKAAEGYIIEHSVFFNKNLRKVQ